MIRHSVVILVTLLLSSVSIPAETLRVATWNLRGATSVPPNGILTNAVEAAAATLKQFDPDVILLQEVKDWKMCLQLAQLVKPAAYEVLICSSFPEASTNGKQNRQAAILSKRKAYFVWSESWSPGQGDKTLSGGFVFASIQTADHRVGLFSVALDGSRDGKVPQQQQWTKQIQSIRKWVTNRPESAIIAGGILGDKAIGSMGDQDQVAYSILSPAIAVNRSQAGQRISARMTNNTEALPALVLTHFPQNCEVDLELVEQVTVAAPTPSTLVETQTVVARIKDEPFSKPIESMTSEPAVAAASSEPFRADVLWLALTPAAIFCLGVLLWFMARHGNKPRRDTSSLEAFPNSGDSVLVTSPSITGSILEQSVAPSVSQPVIQQLQVWQQRALAAEQKAEKANDAIRSGVMSYLAEWLKTKLFRKLMADREQLLESQRAATIQALAVDERLSRLEIQIQNQNQAYEQRIEKLTQELVVTREESRALIRAQIHQIKSEMEAARARLVAEAQAGNGV